MIHPQFIIKANTPKEEISYLIHLTTRKDFFDKHKYSYHYINDPEITKWLGLAAENKAPLHSETEIFKKYAKKYYIKNDYKEAIKNLEAQISKLTESWNQFANGISDINFKYFDKYTINVTNLGPGGSYNSRSGTILLLNPQISFSRKPLFHTLVHELIHIGIQTNYIEKYNLSHNDKEHLVDLICKYQMKDLIPGYKMQNFKNEKMDNLFFKYGLKDCITKYTI